MAKGLGGGMTGNSQALPMIMQALQGANSSAQQSGSPLLAFLAPLATAAIGGRAAQIDEKNTYVSGQRVLDQLAGGAASPRARDLLAALSSGDIPAPLESIAQTMLRQELRLPGTSGTGGGRSRRSSGGSGASSGSGGTRQRLYGEYEINGHLYGRTSGGEMMPFLDAEGNQVPAPQRGSSRAAGPTEVPLPSVADAAPAAPEAPQAAAAEAGFDPNDPLGLLRLPPA